MKHFLNSAAVTAVFVSAGWVYADDACAIKRKDAAAGDAYRVQKTDSETVCTKVAEPGGKALLDTRQTTVIASSYRETVLQCDGATPTKIERVYDKAQLTSDGKTSDLPYQGKTVLIEKKERCYHFTIDGKELAYQEAQPLFKEFSVGCAEKADLERALLTTAPVQVKESWKLDLTQFLKDAAKSGEMGLIADRTQGTASLEKVYTKDGKQFAQVKVALTLPLKSLGKGVLKVATTDGSTATVELDLDGCVDGSCNTATIKSTTKVDAKSHMSLPDGSKAPLTLSVVARSEEVRSDVSKDVTRK